MSYINRVLQPGETVKHKSRPHWFVYIPGLLVLFIGIIGLVALPRHHAYDFYLYGSLAVILIAFAVLVVAWIKRITTEIAVTNKRLIYKEGFISRRTMEMNMDKIESVDVYQTILGRIFDYGTILVRGTGSGLEPLKGIDVPIELRNSVMASASPSASPSAAKPTTPR